METPEVAVSDSMHELAADAAARSAYAAAIRLLARREHSRAELRRKLHAKGHAQACIDAAIDKAADAGQQYDARFAESFVRDRLQRGQGARKIRADLRARGVDGDAACAALPTDDAFWHDRARAALAKRFGPAPPASAAEWAKQARFLAARGFPESIARRAVAPQGAASAADADFRAEL